MSGNKVEIREILLDDLGRSGIPKAIEHQRQFEAVLAEFNNHPHTMADEIIRLRKLL